MKISITMVTTSWKMRRRMATGHSSVMHRKPKPIVVWDSREKRKAPVRVLTSITHGVWLEGGLNSVSMEAGRKMQINYQRITQFPFLSDHYHAFSVLKN